MSASAAAASGAGTGPARWEFEAIGTRWAIDTVDELDAHSRAAVTRLIDAFDRDWSRFRADSVVTGLSAGGRVPVPHDAAAMLQLYDDLSTATDGAINPLVGDALSRRGYDASITLVDHGAQGAPTDWRDALHWNGGELELRSPGMIDVGAVGKGRLVDLVLSELVARVAGRIVVDASGDLAVHGGADRIALEHPYDSSRAIGIWEVADAALCASATNRRSWGDGLHHVLDARTGEPVRTIAATWAVASQAMLADATATALFFDGGPRFAHERDVQWVRMTTDGRVQWSPGSKAELFT